MQRRELLKSLLAGSTSLALVGVHRALLADADLAATVQHPFLTTAQQRSIASLAELILPETDTPGAIAAGVPEFIGLMLSDWYTPAERAPFISGLEQLDEGCKLRHQAAFADCSMAQQTEAFAATEDSDFYRMAKELTVSGYYSSEVGASAEARWNPMPGHYNGDVEWADIGRQWVPQ